MLERMHQEEGAHALRQERVVLDKLRDQDIQSRVMKRKRKR